MIVYLQNETSCMLILEFLGTAYIICLFFFHFSLVLSIKAMILEENVMFPILTDLPCQDQAQTSHGEHGTINRVIVRTQWGSQRCILKQLDWCIDFSFCGYL